MAKKARVTVKIRRRERNETCFEAFGTADRELKLLCSGHTGRNEVMKWMGAVLDGLGKVLLTSEFVVRVC